MKTAKSRRTPMVDEKRLLAYAAAAGAVLAAAGPADASVIHQDVNRTLSGSATEYLTIRTGSIMFNLFNSQSDSPKATAQGTALMCLAQQSTFPLNLDKGAKISANARFSGILFNWGQENNLFLKSGSNYVGNFGNNPNGYLGLRIGPENTTDYRYGWIQITSNTHTAFTIKDWAYQDTLNAPIDAGQISDNPSAVPEPTSCALALIAMGAGGLAVMRRRKQEKQVREAA